MPVKYRRILPVKSLSEVENPWKGISLNCCIFLTMVIVVVSSGVEIIQETLEPLFEEAEEGSDVQDAITDESKASLWDSFAFWKWNSEDESGKNLQHGGKSVPKGIRKREMPEKRLLKERD